MSVSFTQKILSIVLAPVLLFSLLTLVQMQYLIRTLEENTQNTLTAHTALADSHIKDIIADQQHLTRILGTSKEVALSVEKFDNGALTELSRHYLSSRIDAILFTDTIGTVIARPHNEFHFADSVSNTHFFRKTLQNNQFQGIANLDGKERIVTGIAINKYGEIPVGMVFLAKAVDATLLADIGDGIHGSILYSSSQSPHPVPEGAGVIPLTHTYEQNEFDGVTFMLAPDHDKEHDKLRSLQKTVLTNAFLLTIAITAALVVLLKRYFRPYRAVVSQLAGYTGGSTENLKTALLQVDTAKNHEIAAVIKSVHSMIGQIETSMAQLSDKNSELEHISKTDYLTKMYNRRYLDERIRLERKRALRHATPLSLIQIDIDHFKNINDTNGHEYGDEVLVQFAQILRENTRETDTSGRWGGEEFLILCPETTEEQAAQLGEKIREKVRISVIAGLRISISIGVCQLVPPEEASLFIRRADEAMYQAKRSGRNKTVRYSELTPASAGK